MATSREKFSLHWLNELSSRHPPITTTATSSGALSAHLLSRDASVCTATRVLLTATVVELIIFGEQLLSLQVGFVLGTFVMLGSRFYENDVCDICIRRVVSTPSQF